MKGRSLRPGDSVRRWFLNQTRFKRRFRRPSRRQTGMLDRGGRAVSRSAAPISRARRSVRASWLREQATLKPGSALLLGSRSCWPARRPPPNHFATHLFTDALPQVLGDHIAPSAWFSLVRRSGCGFDFSNKQPITAMNFAASRTSPPTTSAGMMESHHPLMAVDDAREAGARALFRRKIPNEVRVFRWARPREARSANAFGWSGGTVRRHPCAANLRNLPESRVTRRERGFLPAFRPESRPLPATVPRNSLQRHHFASSPRPCRGEFAHQPLD